MDRAAGKMILIVEDDPDVAEATRIVLETSGYQTRLAASAEEGMREVLAHPPDLVLLDVMMPTGTEGFHFVWQVRASAEPACRNLPIVIVSAIHARTRLRFYPEQSDGVYRPYEYLPVQGFLDKPASSEALLATVARVLAEVEAPPHGA